MIRRMNKRTISAFSAAIILMVAMRVAAQGQPSQPAGEPSAEDQAAQQQMRQVMMQVMQSMQDKGIDPQQFFGKIMESGGGPAEIQQQLVEQGIIDKDTMAQMQGTFQNIALNRIKKLLGVTDDEWKVMQPAVAKVVFAQGDLGQRAPGGGGMSAGFAVDQTSKLAVAKKDLHAAVIDPSASAGLLSARLQAWRNAYRDASEKLADAQRDLTPLLTVRQEAILSNAGLLP
jgi:hypothetical protein